MCSVRVTNDRDYGVKMADYALYGVREYWTVDVENEAVEPCLLTGMGYILAQKSKDDSLMAEVIPSFTVAIKSVFAFSV